MQPPGQQRNGELFRTIKCRNVLQRKVSDSRRIHPLSERVHSLQEQRENFSQAKRNESGWVPNLFPNKLIKFLVHTFGFTSIFTSVSFFSFLRLMIVSYSGFDPNSATVFKIKYTFSRKRASVMRPSDMPRRMHDGKRSSLLPGVIQQFPAATISTISAVS